MAIQKEITPEQIARIKLRYAARTTPVHDIAREEGVTPSQIYELRRRFGWPSRTELGKRVLARSIEDERAISQALAAAGPPRSRDGRGRFAAAPKQTSEIVEDVRGSLEQELAAAERREAAEAEADAAGRARMLAHFVRTLAMLQKMEESRGPDAASPPPDADALRRELLARLAALREQTDEE